MAAVWRSQCAFTRYFGAKCRKILNNSSDFGKILTPEPISVSIITKNYSNYAKSPFVEKIKEQYEYEIVKDPAAWEYVQRLMPLETIPEFTPKANYPSGWIPPKEEAKDLPFFIARTKNYMLPVYLKLTYRGASKRTHVKKIEGDIWLLNEEIKSHLQETHKRYIETRVHELARFIEVKGDYVNDVVDWAYSKGF